MIDIIELTLLSIVMILFVIYLTMSFVDMIRIQKENKQDKTLDIK